MPGITDSMLTRIVPQLAQVSGIVGIALGGSRARNTANATSDYDIGLYYGQDKPLDTDGLLIVAKELVDDANVAAVTAVGGWGPRIIGGGWLTIEGCKVDLLYRGIESVRPSSPTVAPGGSRWTTSLGIRMVSAPRSGWESSRFAGRCMIREV
jgi:Nucleotidyltransferase domain